jgi:hypothetical protein
VGNERGLAARVRSHFDREPGQRFHTQVDKPLYQPGETIWFRVWDVETRTLADHRSEQLIVELINPRGSAVQTKTITTAAGVATNDFELPPDIEGGEYQVRVMPLSGGAQTDRPVIINTYEAPRVKKTLEFLRKAYGAGDEVTATIELHRPTGEPIAAKHVVAAVRLDGEDLPEVNLMTDEHGMGLLRFPLPHDISAGDGLLTVMVEDGGVTEAISRSIPIIVRRMQLSFFPEGGKLVQGIPSRLYFEARTPLGKPADVEGRVVDDQGQTMATFRSYRNGLGRFGFTPATGRSYHAEVSKPVGVTDQYPLPVAEEKGCVLRTYDDLDGQLAALRAAVTCAESQRVTVVAMVREQLLDAATVEAHAGRPAVVSLSAPTRALAREQGVARVTVFDHEMQPVAERIVYRNRRNRLQVSVAPDRRDYSPREAVGVTVTTKDSDGYPVPADVALSVVDDTVVSYADDKAGNILSRIFLEPELEEKVEEPNFYFDLSEARSALALDLLMGTRGYRTFEWEDVLAPPPPPSQFEALYDVGPVAFGEGRGMGVGGALAAPPPVRALGIARGDALAANRPAPAAERKPQGLSPAKARSAPGFAKTPPAAVVRATPAAPPPPMVALAQVAGVPAERKADRRALHAAKKEARGAFLPRDAANAPDEDGEQAAAPVRIFPVPKLSPDFSGARTDFRETIFWAPSVKTNAEGHARVQFPVSDAVTSFRIFAEGIGGGQAGREETVFKSSLPFSLAVKLPTEVSAGDRPLVPVTITNDRSRPVDVSLATDFGTLVTVGSTGEHGSAGTIAGGGRRSVFLPLGITGTQGDSLVSIRATAGGLSDEFTRTLQVAPLGFPQLAARSGEVKDHVSQVIDLGAVLPGTVTASVKLFPSPLATMVSGMEGLLREPSGCFEQTSSTNYPNVMIMQYLKEQNLADATLLQRSGQLLHNGYARLTGYETPAQGYEWFGAAPAHEALTAYGLLEFNDMKGVSPDVDDAMITRTAMWLRSRRDGKGGYMRDSKALDSFGRASPEVTNAYITYSLVRAGQMDLDPEIAATARLVRESHDPYLLALAAGTLLHVPSHRDEGLAAVEAVAQMQDGGGSWKGAAESITKSGGSNLEIETTALALLALIDAGQHPDAQRRGISWLMQNRGGFGAWGTTQATVLALKAMTAYAEASRATRSAGEVTLLVNGERAGTAHYEAGRRDSILFDDLGSRFHEGANTVELVHEGEPMPYTISVDYRSTKPATSPDAAIDLATTLERAHVRMGESVRLNAVVTNRTAQGQPMTLARVGIPAGLTFQPWQLKQLREKGLVAFWESRAREVILYFRDMQPNEVKRIPIDLIATVPGSYTGPASSAYLYYNDDHKTWVDALAVRIDP